jgi:hypothetical protein
MLFKYLNSIILIGLTINIQHQNIVVTNIIALIKLPDLQNFKRERLPDFKEVSKDFSAKRKREYL